jgi:hypothetical protein
MFTDMKDKRLLRAFSAMALSTVAYGGCDLERSSAPVQVYRPESTDPCHPYAPARSCRYDSECSRYMCNFPMDTCRTSCLYGFHCQSGFVCSASQCLEPGTCGACRGDQDCAAYTCNPAQKCNTTCISDRDCQSGFVCHDHACSKVGNDGVCAADVDCEKFNCNTWTHECKTSCIANLDCRARHRCVKQVCQ